ncbi:hypothetical protein BD779DRAFT_1671565 [Infundibulicybe gibba]|nr:hypothetical protein BD779DRAFT_1671565 [Infundibulicybe gibba]
MPKSTTEKPTTRPFQFRLANEHGVFEDARLAGRSESEKKKIKAERERNAERMRRKRAKGKAQAQGPLTSPLPSSSRIAGVKEQVGHSTDGSTIQPQPPAVAGQLPSSVAGIDMHEHRLEDASSPQQHRSTSPHPWHGSPSAKWPLSSRVVDVNMHDRPPDVTAPQSPSAFVDAPGDHLLDTIAPRRPSTSTPADTVVDKPGDRLPGVTTPRPPSSPTPADAVTDIPGDNPPEDIAPQCPSASTPADVVVDVPSDHPLYGAAPQSPSALMLDTASQTSSPLSSPPISPSRISLGPTALWANGKTTALPFVLGPHGNFLQDDEDRVNQLATNGADARECAWIKYIDIDAFNPHSSVVPEIRSHISRGDVIVIRGHKVESISLDVVALFEKLVIHPERVVEAHDATARVVDWTHPHVRMSVNDFCANATEGQSVQCVLDVPIATPWIPPVISHLDDGCSVGWGTAFGAHSIRTIPADVVSIRSWALLHQPGYHTYTHHDANGLGTFIAVCSGQKFWAFSRPRGYSYCTSRKDMTNMVKEKIIPATNPDQANPWVDYRPQVIFANPGDIIIQPPGAWHEVFTPSKSVVLGGHIVPYETLHLMEASRRLDASHGLGLTNSEHNGIDQTLEHMLTALPSLRDREFFRKPIAALCNMILHPRDYRSEHHAGPVMKFKPEAVKLAKSVLKSQHIARRGSEGEDFLSWGKNWMDPGDGFRFGSFWDELALARNTGNSRHLRAR